MIEMERRRQENDDPSSLLGRADTLRSRIRNPRITRFPPPKTTLAACLMLTLGTLFLSLGLYFYFTDAKVGKDDKGISFIVLGSLMFIPGSYASSILYGAWMGWSGYDYSQVPSYDE